MMQRIIKALSSPATSQLQWTLLMAPKTGILCVSICPWRWELEVLLQIQQVSQAMKNETENKHIYCKQASTCLGLKGRAKQCRWRWFTLFSGGWWKPNLLKDDRSLKKKHRASAYSKTVNLKVKTPLLHNQLLTWFIE